MNISRHVLNAPENVLMTWNLKKNEKQARDHLTRLTLNFSVDKIEITRRPKWERASGPFSTTPFSAQSLLGLFTETPVVCCCSRLLLLQSSVLILTLHAIYNKNVLLTYIPFFYFFVALPSMSSMTVRFLLIFLPLEIFKPSQPADRCFCWCRCKVIWNKLELSKELVFLPQVGCSKRRGMFNNWRIDLTWS